jgi:hypothetical protein
MKNLNEFIDIPILIFKIGLVSILYIIYYTGAKVLRKNPMVYEKFTEYFI